jgi:hypothetical protein
MAIRNVLPDLLWIGNCADGRNVDGLRSLGIEAVVDLAAEEPSASLPRDFVYFRIPLVDGGDNTDVVIRLAVEAARLSVQAARRTLICCSAGLSRSPLVAAAVASREKGESIETVLGQISQLGPLDPSSQLLSHLKRILNE